MIKVTIAKKENKIYRLEVKGHAGSDEYGKDLVCAAVSAVVTGGFNSISEKKSFKFIYDEGHALIEAIGNVNKHDEVVLEVIEIGLKTIAEDNSQFIKIEEK